MEGTKVHGAVDGEQSQADMHQTLSKASVISSDEILLDKARGYLSETQRAITLSSNLIYAGAQLPASIDFVSILMSDYGLWYLRSICASIDITEIGNLSPPNKWIFACLARTVSICYASVSRQLQGFPGNALQNFINVERLTDEINNSQEGFRHRFLLSLSVGGSTSMLEPLLFHGLSMGNLSTYYLEKAIKRGRLNNAYLLFNYGASLSLETSAQLLEHMKPDLKTMLLDTNTAEAFCQFLEMALKSSGPLQELDDKHTIFGSLVLIFQLALLQSKMQHINYGKSSSDGYICNRVVRLLLEAGLFRDSKLPACYWALLLTIEAEYNGESPLTFAIHVGSIYTVKLLIENVCDVDELPYNHSSFPCVERKGTPLMYAVWLVFTEAVAILLEAGADVTKFGALGQTAPEMAKECLALPVAQTYVSSAKDTGLEHIEEDTSSRHQIFRMVCAAPRTIHGTGYEDFSDAIQKRFGNSVLSYAGIVVALFDPVRNELNTCRSPPIIPSLLAYAQELLPLLPVAVDAWNICVCLEWILVPNESVSLLRLLVGGL